MAIYEVRDKYGSDNACKGSDIEYVISRDIFSLKKYTYLQIVIIYCRSVKIKHEKHRCIRCHGFFAVVFKGLQGTE